MKWGAEGAKKPEERKIFSVFLRKKKRFPVVFACAQVRRWGICRVMVSFPERRNAQEWET
jgi:hypothetical protein